MIRIILMSLVIFYTSSAYSTETAACSGDIESTDVQAHCLPINCSSLHDILDFTRSHNERPLVTGNVSTGRRMVLFVNNQTGSWTLVGHKDNRACILIHGHELRNLSAGTSQ